MLDVVKGDGGSLLGEALLDRVDLGVVSGHFAFLEVDFEGDRLSARARLGTFLGRVPHFEDLVATESCGVAELGLDLLLASCKLVLVFRGDNVDSLDDFKVVVHDLGLLEGVLLVEASISGGLLSDEQDGLHGFSALDVVLSLVDEFHFG